MCACCAWPGSFCLCPVCLVRPWHFFTLMDLANGGWTVFWTCSAFHAQVTPGQCLLHSSPLCCTQQISSLMIPGASTLVLLLWYFLISRTESAGHCRTWFADLGRFKCQKGKQFCDTSLVLRIYYFLNSYYYYYLFVYLLVWRWPYLAHSDCNTLLNDWSHIS